MRRKTIFVVAAVAVLGLLAAFGNVMHHLEARNIESAAQAKRAVTLRLAQEKRDALTTEFAANKKMLVSEAQRLIAQNDPVTARNLLAKFAPLQDPDASRLLAMATRNIQTAQQIKQLSDELATKPDKLRSMAIYTELAALEPRNLLWSALVSEARPAVAAMNAQQAKADAAAVRQESVKQLFSGWDGSVRSVEQAIKAGLKDPDSYKHLETRFVDSGTGNVTVITKYSARNSFNAVVPGMAAAMVSPTGELVSFTLKN